MSVLASRTIATVLGAAMVMSVRYAPELMHGPNTGLPNGPEACDAGSCCVAGVEQQADRAPVGEAPAPCCPGVVHMAFVFALPVGRLRLLAPDRTVSILRHVDGPPATSSYTASVWRPPDAGRDPFLETHTHQHEPNT
ncbi:MAG: hypothetical protein KIT10_04855 [Flavobacteriales bacterium]|nr:hypothetical protein [Flavobacteriales bacterium]